MHQRRCLRGDAHKAEGGRWCERLSECREEDAHCAPAGLRVTSTWPRLWRLPQFLVTALPHHSPLPPLPTQDTLELNTPPQKKKSKHHLVKSGGDDLLIWIAAFLLWAEHLVKDAGYCEEIEMTLCTLSWATGALGCVCVQTWSFSGIFKLNGNTTDG